MHLGLRAPIFNTPDYSGNGMFAMLSVPPLSERYWMVLSAGDPSTVTIDF